MPFSPGVEYRGDQYLFRGASSGLNNLGAYLMQKADEHKRTTAETESADVAFKFLTPLLQNDTTAIERFGDELAKYPGASLSQKKSMLGGVTMYLAQKAEQEKQRKLDEQVSMKQALEKYVRDQKEQFVREAGGAFSDKGFDAAAFGNALVKYPGAIDPEKVAEFAYKQGGTNSKPKVPATTKLAGRDVVYSPDTGAFQLLSDPATEMTPYQRATLGLRTLSQRQGMGDPMATAGMSEEERTALMAEYDALGQQLGLKTGSPTGANPKDPAAKVVPMPFPSKKSDLQKDVVYDVPGWGLSRWDGEKFIKLK